MSDPGDDKGWWADVVRDERYGSIGGQVLLDYIQKEIEPLTDEQAQANSIVIVSTLRGMLRHERALVQFAKPDFVFGERTNEEYADEIKEAVANEAEKNLPPQSTPAEPPKPRRRKK